MPTGWRTANCPLQSPLLEATVRPIPRNEPRISTDLYWFLFWASRSRISLRNFRTVASRSGIIFDWGSRQRVKVVEVLTRRFIFVSHGKWFDTGRIEESSDSLVVCCRQKPVSVVFRFTFVVKWAKHARSWNTHAASVGRVSPLLLWHTPRRLHPH